MDSMREQGHPIWLRKKLETEKKKRVGAAPFIANAPSMRKLLTLVEIAASTREPVLVTGETGTGKELIARMVHDQSERSSRPFVPVNCAAIPESLFEREFFGHAKGAYTGAEQARAGLCEEADGGTLFLDEIGDMPSYLQVKLLRLLQEGTYRRLGDPEERRVDLRIVAATNAPLPDLIAAGRFRQDLYYRLQTLEMPIPPLRERPEDLDDLMNLFVRQALDDDVSAATIFARGVLNTFRRYPWPGNVRELEAMTRRMALMARHSGQATVDMLPEQLARWRERRVKQSGSLSLTAYLEEAERGRIDQALILKAGNRSEAARALGISRNQLYRKMEKLGIRAPR
ncbi:MAG TPA: sigma-54 dependent transcriptional regulator [Candidatus Krumholzibacteria bacterium]|nr:sigma-54 dependent transcriptional regulator [Candidatus Krumholzibacteria bacterium]